MVVQRLEFFQELLALYERNEEVFFFDESSTHLWESYGKVWQPKGEHFLHKIPRSRGVNVTIMGIMSSHRVFSKLAPTTNAATCLEFFSDLCERFKMNGRTIVLDNHRAHYSLALRNLLEKNGVRLLFLPPTSSAFNPNRNTMGARQE